MRNVSYLMRMKIVEAMSYMTRKLLSGEWGANRFLKKNGFCICGHVELSSQISERGMEGWQGGSLIDLFVQKLISLIRCKRNKFLKYMQFDWSSEN